MDTTTIVAWIAGRITNGTKTSFAGASRSIFGRRSQSSTVIADESPRRSLAEL
jgi:hypothetical protein